MGFNKNFLKGKWVPYTIATCSAVVVYLLLSNIGTFLGGINSFLALISPILSGVVIAYVLNPIMLFYERKVLHKVKGPTIRHSLAVLLTVISVILAIVILMVALIPQIVSSVVTFIENFESYANTSQSLFDNLEMLAANYNFDISNVTEGINKMLNNLSANLTTHVSTVINTSYNIGLSVFNSVISFILAIYYLSDKDRLLSGCKQLFKVVLREKKYKSFAGFMKKCDAILIRYIGCDLLDGLIVGIINGIFMKILNMPYIILISVIVGITNLAPTFGPIIGAVIGGFILLLINPWHALWFILLTLALQTVDGYFIKPKLFGNSLGVPGVWILISIIFFGRLFGVAGILMAIPFAAIVDFVYHDLLDYFDQKKAQQEQEKESSDKESSDEKSSN